MTPVVQGNGGSVSYDVAGQGDPPIVFVHGWCCDRTYFQPQFAHFAARHRAVAVDLRGHGESDAPDPGAGAYAITTFADDVDAAIAGAGIERPVVVGHSMGGVVAVELARRGHVRAAVLVDPARLWSAEPSGLRDRFLALADDVESDHDGGTRRAIVDGMFMPTDTVRRAAIIDGMSARPAGVAAASLRAFLTYDGLGALAEVTVPVLSIGSLTPANDAAALRAALPSIAIGQTVGAGHFNQLEVPDQVNAMIERFLLVNDL